MARRLAVAALLLVPCAAARLDAEEPPAPAAPAPGAPPVPPGVPPSPPGFDAQAELLKAGVADLRALALALLPPLEDQRTPPRKTIHERALFDAWTSILEPRIGRMVARVNRIAEEPRWQPPAVGTTRLLKPESFDVVLREASSLYAELGGAHEQYLRFQVSWTIPGGGGLTGPQGPPDPDAHQRALERLASLEATLAWKVQVGAVVWTDELAWYWSVARHAEVELLRYQRDLERWQRQVAAFEDVQARVGYGLALQRQSLAMSMFGLRALVAGLQAGEEDRLRAASSALPESDARRVEAFTILEDLRVARNAAENHAGAQPSTWGSMLRQKWNGPRLRLRALLKV